MKNMKIKIIVGIIYALYVGIYYYIALPPLNWHDPFFYTFMLFTLGPLILLVLLFNFPKLENSRLNEAFNKKSILDMITKKEMAVVDTTNASKRFRNLTKILLGLLVLLIVLPFVSGIINCRLFHASTYAARINPKSVEFTEIPEVDFKTTPIIDRDSSETLGDKVMGNMSEWVSQFNVSDEYTQISYHGGVSRVTPLTYNGIIKYFTNRDDGIPAYIRVDSTNGKTDLVKLADLGLGGMKYVPSAMFNDNLMRRLRFSYPTAIFGSPSFEIDEEGHPWYICSTYTYQGIGSRKQVTGAIFLDPITGESTQYELDKIPSWADRIFPEGLVIEELNDYGGLQKGYINSVIGQSGVTKTSEGYNYLSKDGDIWLYTGVTSANSDQSNLAFVLVNLRTHEAMRIASAGANETSAMVSAQAEVKNYGYISTFPLLTNVKGNPVYLMSLKDNGIIKMYAMVSAIDYQKVAVVNSDDGLDMLVKKMMSVLGESKENVVEDSLIKKTIVIKQVQIIQNEGNTIYYLMSEDDELFKINFNVKYEKQLVFLKAGDKLSIKYIDSDDVKVINSIE